MNGFSSRSLTAAALGLALTLALPMKGEAQQPGSEPKHNSVQNNAEASQRPLLLELFTSQGCYSCPPADKLLRELSKYEQLIPLSFHVDYWNHLGWRDPFSHADWSARQRQYARVLRSDTVYTPQLVIDGRVDEVGSDRMEVLNKIAERLEIEPHSEARVVELTARLLVPSPANKWNQARIEVNATASPALTKNQVLLVALYERHLETEIPSGENRNKTLHYDYVVRRLAQVDPGQTATLTVDSDWKRTKLGVVGFVQDAKTGDVLGIKRVSEPLPAQ